MHNDENLAWSKPSMCEADNDCPNWAWASDGSLVLRDSLRPGQELRFNAKDAALFIEAVLNGEVAPRP